MTSEEKAKAKSVEDTQQDYQMEEQQNTHRAVANGEHDVLAENTLHQPSRESNKKSRMKRQLKKDLSKQGLMNGIIMNEVLGPSRAMKPYKSVTAERKK